MHEDRISIVNLLIFRFHYFTADRGVKYCDQPRRLYASLSMLLLSPYISKNHAFKF